MGGVRFSRGNFTTPSEVLELYTHVRKYRERDINLKIGVAPPYCADKKYKNEGVIL